MIIFVFLLIVLFQTFYSKTFQEYNEFMRQILEDNDFSTLEYEDFLKRYPDYGYNGTLDDIVRKDLRRAKGETYLDYTGAGVYRDSQLDKYYDELKNVLYGNSHSLNPSSLRTTHMLDYTRELILKFFNTTTDEYTVIFTSGATASLKLVGDSFPWSYSSRYYYLQQNHNSVLGIREIVKDKGGEWRSISPDKLPKKEQCHPQPIDSATYEINSHPNPPFHLFAFPAEDNFAGVKYPLEWIELCHQNKLFNNTSAENGVGQWKVLLDAAAFVPTNRLDLYKYKPDFVALSFYKMFGYPTGTGALIVKNDIVDFLSKRYFGGGTVIFASEESNYCLFHREACSKFEDGTPNFLSILGIKYGLDAINEFGIDTIQKHVYAITQFMYERLSNLKHSNGVPLAEIYGKHHLHNPEIQGGIISLNIKDKFNHYIGYYDVQVRSAKRHIHIRTGCHCNPGGCKYYLGVNDELYKSLAENRTSCGDKNDVIDDKATGNIRISMGYLTSYKDAMTIIRFFEEYLQ